MPAVPELIAHRGLPRRLPENTLPGFEAAIAAGADALELDVHGTRDGVVVLHHDPGLPDGRAIADLSADEVAGLGLPTLDAVLAATAGRVRVYIEIKAPHIEAAVQRCRERAPDTDTAVHCFVHDIARVFTPFGLLLDRDWNGSLSALAPGARDLWPHYSLVTPGLVSAAHARGLRVLPWTVNDVDLAHQLVAAGVDGLCTDLVDEMREVFPRG